jgi:hypothetical protein
VTEQAGRRRVLQAIGIGFAALGSATAAGAAVASHQHDDLLPPGADTLRALSQRLAAMPRRRGFKTVPMVLQHRDEWDDEPLAELMAYKGGPKQVWDVTEIGGPWLNGMRNAINAQVWSFGHPDFLVVSATHGTANLALYDQTAWEKYRLADLAGDRFKSNTLIVPAEAAAENATDFENPGGAFSQAANSIDALMRRGAVFTSCHNSIWEQAFKLLAMGVNPDKLSGEALAADLTNHLIEGVVLTPGASATLPELQRTGFHYIR